MNRDPHIIDPPPPDTIDPNDPRVDPVYRDRYVRPADSGTGGLIAGLVIAAVVAGGAIWYLRGDNATTTANNPPASTVGQGTRPMAPVMDKVTPAPVPSPPPQMAPTPTPDPAAPTNVDPKP